MNNLKGKAHIFDEIEGLIPVDPKDLADYEHEMKIAIPEMIQAENERRRLAHEARQHWLG